MLPTIVVVVEFVVIVVILWHLALSKQLVEHLAGWVLAGFVDVKGGEIVERARGTARFSHSEGLAVNTDAPAANIEKAHKPLVVRDQHLDFLLLGELVAVRLHLGDVVLLLESLQHHLGIVVVTLVWSVAALGQFFQLCNH